MRKRTHFLIALIASVLIMSFSSCEEKTPKEKIKDGIEEVGEGVKDAGEDVKDKVEEGVEEVKDEVDDHADDQ